MWSLAVAPSLRVALALALLAAAAASDDVGDLVAQLSDPERRERAEDELVRLGAAAVPALLANLEHGQDALVRIGAPAVAPLVDALEGADKNKLYDIITTLGRLGPVARPAVPALRLELAGYWDNVAAAELTKITLDATWGVPAMIEELEREGPMTDTFAALARLGPSAKAAAPILRKLGRTGRIWRAEALRALWWIEGDAEALLPDLRALLGVEGEADSAAIVLGIMGEAARPAVPDLLRVLRSRKGMDRLEAFEALVEIGLRPEDAPLVRTLLESEQEQLRWYGAGLLGSIRPFPEKWVADLAALVDDESANVRAAVAFCLGRIGHATAVPALVRACSDEVPDVSCVAARGLAAYPKHPDTVPALCRMVQRKSGWDRWHAAWALGEIGAASAVDVLTTALRDEDESLRRQAALTLGKLNARSAAAAIEKLLADPDPETAAAAAIALHALTGDAHLAPFRAALDSEFPYVAFGGVEKLRAAARPLLPQIEKLRDHRDCDVAASAVYAAYVLGDDADDAVQRLVHLAAIQYGASDARSVVFLLGEIGPAAKQAKPFLVGLMRAADGLDDVVRIRETLARIDPK